MESSSSSSSSSKAALERIEQLEAELLQHVHSAGLRSQRERQIADEVGTLRLERRKLFSSLAKEIESLRDETVSLNSAFDGKARAQRLKYKAAINELLQKNEEYRNKLAFVKSESKRILDEEKEKLNRTYESKILLLERKMGEINDAGQIKVQIEAEKIATQRIAENETNLEKVLSKKIDKYKQTINNLVEIEKASVKANEYSAKEIIMLKKKNNELEKNLSEAMAINSNINEVLSKINYDNQAKDSVIVALTSENRGLSADHKKELDSIDAKIRQILASKDAVIADLRNKYDNSERERKGMESLLVRLNKSFTSGNQIK